MITVIKKEQLQDLDNLIANLPIDNCVFNKIVKYRNRIEKIQQEHYKYGSSWLDLWFLKKELRSINKYLKKYTIVLV